MPGENKGKKYIITAIDYATIWSVAQATKEHKGNECETIYWERNLSGIFLTTPFYKTRIWAQFSLETKTKISAVPPIGETATKQEGVKKEFKKASSSKLAFYRPTVDRAAKRQSSAGCTPSLAACLHAPSAAQSFTSAASCQPASRKGTAHLPRQGCPPRPDGEIAQLGIQTRQFPPSPKMGGTAA
ncbi:hypothetical protein DSO57_1038726 [Entomophthora muscae]|uniref:Uncharacterized protein n=1 Tax=Entomophthora muscae TaxID=34485 RepID=A0ACC2UJB7_9FUNG|nr:hypothetical protein DSO57_1038726 [Entomophthora muscae]